MLRKLFARPVCLFVAVLLLSTSFLVDANHPRLDTIRDRIETRNYPSLFGAWGHPDGPPVLDRDDLSKLQVMALYDVHWGSYLLRWEIKETPKGTTLEPVLFTGHISVSNNWERWFRRYNPNHLSFYAKNIFGAHRTELASDSPYWLRDQNGDRVDATNGYYFLDITNPDFQSIVIEEIVLAAESGLYDGVHLDSFRCCTFPTFFDSQTENAARTSILAGIRARVHPDFLIIVNTNRDRVNPNDVSYINGIHMETVWDHGPGHFLHPYTPAGLAWIEDTLLWASENLRQPTVNCLEGFGIGTQVFDSPDNMRWMRLFTTMSLVLDDGSMLYNKALNPGLHDHHWYAFWDADLGQPVGPKAQHYLVDGSRYVGLYIREFTNGWALYNRSSISVNVELPDVTAAISTGKYDYIHTVPSLDGEIFLKSHTTRVHPRELLTTSWAKIKTQ